VLLIDTESAKQLISICSPVSLRTVTRAQLTKLESLMALKNQRHTVSEVQINTTCWCMEYNKRNGLVWWW